METCFIYSLSYPKSNIRYIGKTNNINKRLNSHLCKSNLKNKTHKNTWIKSLLKNGLKPIIEVIDVVPIEDWVFWERYWISQMKTWGFNLTNATDGGDQVKNVIKFGCENNNFNHKIIDDEILKLIKDGTPQKTIAKMLDTNVAMIKRRMVKYNIDFRKLRGERIKKGITHNYRNDISYEMVIKYINEGFSINKISKILNTDRSTIKNRIKEYEKEN